MKAELITKDEFKPVTIQLTFETKEEFETFLNVANRFYLTQKVFEEQSEYYFSSSAWYDITREIYKTLNESK